MSLLTKYWGGNTRVYHHTPPINMFYGIYQSILNVLEEGLDNVYARHQRTSDELVKGLEEMGWEMLVDKDCRLPMLNAVIPAKGVDEAKLRATLLKDYNTEISSGLGDLTGKIVRIGLMGYNAQSYNVEFILNALKEITSR
jgi:alanine-glyoxylate transaminase/serine-glyoxylate transaminase/serine-pyruvate transaminase